MLKKDETRLDGLELGENIETLFKVVPPFSPAHTNFGYIGVLLRDKIEDKIQCHECGKWYRHLGVHISQSHDCNARQYRIKFGLPLNFPLCGRGYSLKRSNIAIKHKISEKNLLKSCDNKIIEKRRLKTLFTDKYRHSNASWLNKHGICDKQILNRYIIVSDIVGREATYTDIKNNDKNLLSNIYNKFKTFSNFKKYYDLTPPRKIGGRVYSDEYIISELIKSFNILKRIPRPIDFDGKIPSRQKIRKHFGSWNRALQMAGLVIK